MSSQEQGIAPMSTDGKIPVHVKQLLIIDPDDRFAAILKTALGTAYSLDHVSNIDDGIARLKQNDVDVVLLNWDWPKSELPIRLKCQEFLEEADSVTAPIPVLVFTWDRRRECAMENVRQGAFDVFLQPLDVLELKFALDRAYVRTTLHRDLSAARALAQTLIEDELFGHEKGAFTGAAQTRRGRFEQAQGGTVFLDEIGDLALSMQVKLLRVLQERTLERLGSSTPVPVDIRLICATNRDLETMVRQGTFRQDLYFRISVFRIDLPALRERRTDIPILAEFFCRHFGEVHKKDIRGLSPRFLSTLASYEWPGNVRELQNVIERSLILADGSQLSVEDLPSELKPLVVSAEIPRGSFHEAVDCFRRELILAALRTHSGNRLKAAREDRK